MDNGDGTASYSIGWLDYYDFLKEERARILDLIVSVGGSSGDASSISRCEYKDIANIKFFADQDTYSLSDIIAIYGLCTSIYQYQIYSDYPYVDIDDTAVTINIADNKSNQVFSTINFPKDLNKLSDSFSEVSQE